MELSQIETRALFEPNHSRLWRYLAETTYPWEIVPHIKDAIYEIGKGLDPDIYQERSDGVWVAKSAEVSETALLQPPVIVGERSVVRHCAYVRGSVLIGDDCVVGNSVELKNCALFDGVQVPHYNYVGDAILGHRAHLGAGAITSNVKGDSSLVCIKGEGFCLETGYRKLGAMVGDEVEVGCNAVLQPGCVVGQRSRIYPLASVRGVIPPDSILKTSKNSTFLVKRQ